MPKWVLKWPPCGEANGCTGRSLPPSASAPLSVAGCATTAPAIRSASASSGSSGSPTAAPPPPMARLPRARRCTAWLPANAANETGATPATEAGKAGLFVEFSFSRTGGAADFVFSVIFKRSLLLRSIFLVQIDAGTVQQSQRESKDDAANTAFQVAGAVRSLRRRQLWANSPLRLARHSRRTFRFHLESRVRLPRLQCALEKFDEVACCTDELRSRNAPGEGRTLTAGCQRIQLFR